MRDLGDIERRGFDQLSAAVSHVSDELSNLASVMEWGFEGVLLNTAIAGASDPVMMAAAFRDAIRAGRTAHRAGMMTPRDMASPSTPTIGTPFWHQAEGQETSSS